VRPRRSKGRCNRVVRYLAWLCLFLTLWPGFSIAADTPPPSTVPVVTNVSGAVVVRSAAGTSRDVLNSRIVHAGDTLVTGVDSLAVLSLADVGTIRLGPGSTARALATASSLSLGLDVGSMCAQAQTRAITIHAGNLAIAAGDDTAIFNVIRDPNETTIAVYQGQVSTTLGNKSQSVLHAGEAAVSSHGGDPVQVPIESVQTQFSALKCPDDAIIARALPTPEPSPASGGHGGGGGGFLGILLGIGALAALAGHGGGGGGGGGGQPTPPSGPGQLSVNPTSLSFLVGGASQSFTASESNYSGPINASSGNVAIATVTPASGGNPTTFTVTPTGAGSTNITVTDNHGGSQIVSVTVTPPGVLSVNPTSLSFLVGGASQTFGASESSYTGAITASSGDKAVATVSPASGSSPVTFTVTPTGPGTTTITVKDDHGGAITVNITVTPPGSLSATPGNLTFTTPAAGGTPQPFTANQSSYTGPITAVSNDVTVATVSGSGNGPSVTFTVTPVGPGSTTITVSGGGGQTATVAISVIGPLTTNPTTLTFSGTTSTQNFTAMDPLYSGTLTASVDKPSVATVSPLTRTGPGPVTFHVDPHSEGSATVTVSDTFGQTAQVSVVVSAGGLTVNPTDLTFTVTGAPQTFSAVESDYTSPITATSNHPGIASVAPGSGNGPTPPPFTVTPVSAGNASIAVSDTHANTKFVDVTVTGPLTPTPASLTFNGTTATQSISVNDPNYFGSVGASSTDVGVATVTSPGTGPNASFTVTPVNQTGASGTATINFTDSNSGATSATVTVIPGPLTVDTSSVTLNGIGATAPFNASETLYSGAINASSDTPGVATVTPSSGSGPGPVPFTIRANGAGTATVTVTDSHGGSKTISVTVNGAPSVSPGSLTFTDVGAPNAQAVTVSDPGYSGPFGLTSDTCTGSGVASLSAPGSGPSSSVTVTPLAAGSCQFAVQDTTHGITSSLVSVTVGPFGAISPNPTSLTFSDITPTQSFTVSEGAYTGLFTINQAPCAGIATVNPLSGDKTTSFVVTPASSASGGTCNLSITDDHGTSAATVAVTVGPFGALTPSKSSSSINTIGGTDTFTGTETGYSGLISAASANTGVATVAPASGAGPGPVTFTITAVAVGNTTITISDDHGGSVQVRVFVTTGSLIVSPTTLTFPSGGVGQTMTFTASDAACGALDMVTATPDGTVAASVSPSGPQPCPGTTTFTVTAGADGRGSVSVSDTAGGSAVVSVGVGQSPLARKRRPIRLAPSRKIPLPSPSPVGVTPTPPPHQVVPPEPTPVLTGPLIVSAANFRLVSGEPPPTILISEVGYTRLFTVSSSNTAVVTITAATALGPNASVAIVPRGAGIATITITDDHGGVRVITVVVRSPGVGPPHSSRSVAQ